MGNKDIYEWKDPINLELGIIYEGYWKGNKKDGYGI